MLTKISVQRSNSWVKAQRLARGENVPQRIVCEVAIESLSEAARRVLLDARSGVYSEKYDGFGFDSTYCLSLYSCYGTAFPQLDGDGFTPAEIDAAIVAMAGCLEAKRAKMEAERAAAAERERLESEAAAEKARKLTDARELLAAEIAAAAGKLQRMTDDRQTLASFLTYVPQDALRGALKSYAAAMSGGTIDELREQVEDASPFVVFVFEDEDEDEDEDDN